MTSSNTEPVMKATREELRRERIPLEWRDYCAHKLIPLNQCRRATLYLPWKCQDERHAYEKCQYLDYKRRMKKATQAAEAAAAAQ